MDDAAPLIRSSCSPAGVALVAVGFGPHDLPPVRTGDLEEAWSVAHDGGIEGVAAPHVLIRFACQTGMLDLSLADRDARCWAAALRRRWSLEDPRGLSILLRLLALVDLLTCPDWHRRYRRPALGGARVDPALLRAVANAPFSPQAELTRSSVEARLDLGLAPRHCSGTRVTVPTGVLD